MTHDPRKLLNEYQEGLRQSIGTNGEVVKAFLNLVKNDYKSGAIDTKTKELISVGIAAYNRCEYCIVYHVHEALAAGATKEEIMESAMVAVVFGGGPTMAYSVTLLKDSIEEFTPDFNK